MYDHRTPTAPRVIGVIPARGGSKGIPRKNLALVGGTSLLGHAVRHGLGSGVLDDVVVSTDDDEIAAEAIAAGASVIRRPAVLAGDRAPTLPVLLHVLDELEARGSPPIDAVVTLQPTSPLRSAADVAAAVGLFVATGEAVVGVCEAEHSPYKMWRESDGHLAPFFPDVDPGTPRQALPVVFRENGAVYVSPVALLRAGSIRGDRPVPYVMQAASSVDIDTPLDLVVAEHLLARRAPTHPSE